MVKMFSQISSTKLVPIIVLSGFLDYLLIFIAFLKKINCFTIRLNIARYCMICYRTLPNMKSELLFRLVWTNWMLYIDETVTQYMLDSVFKTNITYNIWKSRLYFMFWSNLLKNLILATFALVRLLVFHTVQLVLDCDCDGLSFTHTQYRLYELP